MRLVPIEQASLIQVIVGVTCLTSQFPEYPGLHEKSPASQGISRQFPPLSG
jgi:hypothetical protein